MTLGGGSAILLSVVPTLNPLDEPILVSLPISLAALLVATAIWPNRESCADPNQEPYVGQ